MFHLSSQNSTRKGSGGWSTDRGNCLQKSLEQGIFNGLIARKGWGAASNGTFWVQVEKNVSAEAPNKVILAEVPGKYLLWGPQWEASEGKAVFKRNSLQETWMHWLFIRLEVAEATTPTSLARQILVIAYDPSLKDHTEAYLNSHKDSVQSVQSPQFPLFLLSIIFVPLLLCSSV